MTEEVTRLPARQDKRPSMALSDSGMLEPKSFEDAYRLANMLAESTMVPDNYRGKPGDCLIAMQLGAEVGLKPMQSLQSIAVVNGKPTIYGDGLLALCRSHPKVKAVTETMDTDTRTAVCRVTRTNGEVIERAFSWKDAQQAGLDKKQGPWKSYPRRMLQMRARAWALRDACADILMGLAVGEEVEDYDVTVKDDGGASALNARLSAPSSEECAHAEVVVQGEGPTEEVVCAECGEVLDYPGAKAAGDLPANIPSRPTPEEIFARIRDAKSEDDLQVAEDMIRELARDVADEWAPRLAEALDEHYARVRGEGAS